MFTRNSAYFFSNGAKMQSKYIRWKKDWSDLEEHSMRKNIFSLPVILIFVNCYNKYIYQSFKLYIVEIYSSCSKNLNLGFFLYFEMRKV